MSDSTPETPTTKTHWFIFGTLPDLNDYRFLFDVVRLSKAIVQCSQTTLDKLHIYTAYPQWWTGQFDVALKCAEFETDTQTLQELNYVEVVKYARDPSMLCQDLEDVKISPGDRIFIYITNHGSTSRISISQVLHLESSSLLKSIYSLLDRNANVLLFISACSSTRFARPMNEEFCKKKKLISIFTDDPEESTSANVAFRNHNGTLIGTEFCHLLLAYISNLKSNDNPSIGDFAGFMKAQSQEKFSCFLGGNRDDTLPQFMGRNYGPYYSPLCRSPAIEFYTVYPFRSNGKAVASEQKIKPHLKLITEVILGRALADSDFAELNLDSIEDTHSKLIHDIFYKLISHRLIVPGIWPGGQIVYLLASLAVTPEKIEEVLSQVKKDHPTMFND